MPRGTVWESLGGELTGDPAACSWGPERIDLFCRGRDGTLHHCWYEPAGWQPWRSLGIATDADPTACAPYPGRVDVFVRGADGDLRHGAWSDGTWAWE